jgi:hypothetical protein
MAQTAVLSAGPARRTVTLDVSAHMAVKEWANPSEAGQGSGG